MAKIFVDTNIFIDWVEGRKTISLLDKLEEQTLVISPLSIHILAYLYKYKMPSSKLSEYEQYLVFVPMDKTITFKALTGPTSDFEDNVQLHSCASYDCDYFLTSDKDLLRTKFFGKTQIVDEI